MERKVIAKSHVKTLPLLGFMVCANAQSATYEVSGMFTTVGIYEGPDRPNLVTEGSAIIAIEGYIVTDTDQPGYSIIDGEFTYDGEVVISYPPFGSGLVEYNYSRGYPGSDGITFYEGGYCSNIVARICQDVSDFPGDSFELSASDRFVNVPISGLRLTGGAGGASFAIAQPGGVTPTLGSTSADWSKAVGFISDLRDVGLFLEGDLNFTRVEDQPGPRPNIVVVQAGSYSSWSMTSNLSGPLTPNARSIISDEGALFDQSFVTNPDTTASLATLLTGLYTHNHGVYSGLSPNALVGGMAWDGWLPNGTDPGLEGNTLATWLQAAGYRTGFVGKYLAGYGDVAPQNVSNPATYIPAGWDDWYGLVGYAANWMYDYTLNENGTLVDYGTSEPDYQTDVLATKAADFVRSNGSDPLFLLISSSAPNVEVLDPLGFFASDDPLAHLDLRIRPAPRHAYLVDGDLSNGEETVPIRTGNAQFLPTTPGCPRPALPVGISVIDKPFCVRESPEFTDLDILRAEGREKSRHAALRAVDDLVGEVADALSSIGELDNTVFVFTSATGGLEGTFNQYGKALAYGGALQVPLAIRTPNTVKKGTVLNGSLVTNVDLAPTLACFAGVTPPYDPDGFVRKANFDGHPAAGDGRDYFLIEHWFMPGFDRFATPSFLGWRSAHRGGFPFSRYISTRANPDDFSEVTGRELTRVSGAEERAVAVSEEVGDFYDTVLEVLHGCAGAQCREYERER